MIHYVSKQVSTITTADTESHSRWK